jgi:O-antigen/teichoic acid export membrane protein
VNPLKKLASEAAIYGLSSIVGRTLNYLLIPLYTAYFLPSEMGIYTKLYSLVAFFNVIYIFGMETAYFRFASKSTESESKIFNVSVSFIIINSLILSGILLLFAPFFSSILGFGIKPEYISYFAIILAIDAFIAIPFAQLRLQKKAVKFAVIKLTNIALNIGFNVFFIVICKMSFENSGFTFLQPYLPYFYNPNIGVGYIFISNLLANILIVPFFYKSVFSFRFNFEIIKTKELFFYAFPLMLMGLTGMVNEVIDRIVLEFWLTDGFYPNRTNIDAVGIYGAVYKISIFMSLAIQAFRYAADPFFFSKAEDKNSPQLFANVSKWFLYACLFIFILVSINLDLLANFILLNKVYHEGLAVVPVLLLANLFLGLYYNFSVWYKITDKTYYGTYLSIFGAFLTVMLNFLLIPYLGYMGSAIATLICYFSMAILSMIIGQKYFYIPYQYFVFIAFTAISIAMVYFKPLFLGGNYTADAIYSIICVFVFVAAIYFTEFKKAKI